MVEPNPAHRRVRCCEMWAELVESVTYAEESILYDLALYLALCGFCIFHHRHLLSSSTNAQCVFHDETGPLERPRGLAVRASMRDIASTSK